MGVERSLQAKRRWRIFWKKLHNYALEPKLAFYVEMWMPFVHFRQLIYTVACDQKIVQVSEVWREK